MAHPRGRRARLALGSLLVTTLVLAGCVSTGSAGTGGTGTPGATQGSASPSPSASGPAGIAHPTGASDLVLQVATGGGFVSPTFRLTNYPMVSIYGDGSVVAVGPQIEIYPGPLLPNLLVRHISQAGIERLLAMAKQEGLFDKTGSFDAVGIADAGTTELTFVTDARHTISAYALGEQTDDSQLDLATAAVRAAMRRFVASVSDLPTTLGRDVLDTEQPYRATELRLYVTPGDPGSDPNAPPQQAHAWPLATPLGAFGEPFGLVGSTGGRCGTVTGRDLDALMPVLRQANVLTPWLSSGSTYGLVAHPLLPGETGCPPES